MEARRARELADHRDAHISGERQHATLIAKQYNAARCRFASERVVRLKVWCSGRGCRPGDDPLCKAHEPGRCEIELFFAELPVRHGRHELRVGAAL